jgi:hypothetical protein
MRPVSFSALLRIVHLVAEHPDGLRAGQLDAEVRYRAIVSTHKGSSPARSTLYHHRNTLVHLGTLERRKQLLRVNVDDPSVRILLDCPSPIGSQLDHVARDTFAKLVLDNQDCKELFFDLFMPSELLEAYGVLELRTSGRSMVWRRVSNDDGRTEVILQADSDDRMVTLRSPSEIKGVLYGLRYWARDELALADEFFREGRGSVLYPLLPPEESPSAYEVVGEILHLARWKNEWAMLSVRDLIVELCEKRRRPLKNLFDAIEVLEREYLRYVVLVPTSSSFATLTARSVAREEFELRGYFRDAAGRYISHLRIHNSIRRRSDAHAS